MSLHMEGKEVNRIILDYMTKSWQEIPEMENGGNGGVSNAHLSDFLLRLGLANNNAVKTEPRDGEEDIDEGKRGENIFRPVSF